MNGQSAAKHRKARRCCCCCCCCADHVVTTPPHHHTNTTTTQPQHNHNTTTPQQHHNTTNTTPQPYTNMLLLLLATCEGEGSSTKWQPVTRRGTLERNTPNVFAANTLRYLVAQDIVSPTREGPGVRVYHSSPG